MEGKGQNLVVTRVTWFHDGLLMSFEKIVLMVGAHLSTKLMQKALSLIPSPCNKFIPPFYSELLLNGKDLFSYLFICVCVCVCVCVCPLRPEEGI